MAISKKQKLERRKKEILKAQVRGGVRPKTKTTGVDTQPRKRTQTLNVGAIKTDLVKTLLFAALAVGFILFVKFQGLELTF